MPELLDTIKEIETSNCPRCVDLVDIRNKIVVSRGNPHSDIVIVGQNPGAQEDECGQPFMGRAGQLLDGILTSAGYNPNEDFFFTNVVLCHTENNTVPTTRHMINCSYFVKRILAPFSKIVTVGKAATLGVIRLYEDDRTIHLYESKTATKMLTNGMPIRINKYSDNKNLFVTYHPSYLARNGITIGDIENDKYNCFMEEITKAKEYKEKQGSYSFDDAGRGGLW